MEQSLSEYIHRQSTWYGVIPRGDLLDLSNRNLEKEAAVAWFRYKVQARKFGEQYWHGLYTIVEANGPLFGCSENQ